MADPDEPDIAAIVAMVRNPDRAQVAFDYRVTRDMGQTAADAARDVAKYQFAVPARNRTYRAVVGGAVLSLVGWLAVNKLESKDLGPVLVAVAVSAGAVLAVREYRKKRTD